MNDETQQQDDSNQQLNSTQPASMSSANPFDRVNPSLASSAQSTVADTTAATSVNSSASIIDSTAPKKKRRLLLGIIIAAVIVILGGGGAAAYNFWYQNPTKVISDAIGNMISAKTTTYTANITGKSNDTNLNISLNGKQSPGLAGSLDATIEATSNSQKYNLSGSGLISDGGDLYVKLSNLGDIKSYAEQSLSSDGTTSAEAASLITQLISKIDNQWIKVSSSDLENVDGNYSKIQQCAVTSLNVFRNSKTNRNQITALYNNNQFLTVSKKLATKNGSLGYQISVNKKLAINFVNGLKSTDIYKQLHNCDSRFIIDSDSLSASETSTATTSVLSIWVDRWSHQLTELSITSTDSSDKSSVMLDIKPTFNKTVNVTVPNSSMTLSQIEDDMKASIVKYYNSVYDSSTAQL